MTKHEKFDLLADKAGEFEAVIPLIDDNDLVAVQPQPLSPVFSDEEGDGPVAVQPLPLGPALASEEGNLRAGEFTDLRLEMESEPYFSAHQIGGDLGAAAQSEVLLETGWHYTVGGFYDKMMIISDGLLVTDADQLVINAEDEGHTVNYGEWFGSGSRHFTEHHYYTAIDASNANGYVNYQGVTKTYWTGETSMIGRSYDFSNVFKGGDYGNTIISGNFGDTMIGGAGDDTFYSTGGDNTWTGTGGANTFQLNGGASLVTDFREGSDTILIEKTAYVAANANYAANLKWAEGQDSWMLFDLKNLDTESPGALVTLEKGDGFEGAMAIGIVRPNGSTNVFTPEVWTQDNLGVDFIV